MDKVKRIVEAAVYLSQEPISAEELSKKLGLKIEEVKEAIKQLIEDYRDRGIVIRNVAGGYKFFTAPDIAETIKQFVEDKPIKLSKHLMEVLSIVAYKQPVTKKEIVQIRGQNCDGALKSLIEKGLIEVAERAHAPGRPKLYRTTKSFLYHFGIDDISSLPEIQLEETHNGTR